MTWFLIHPSGHRYPIGLNGLTLGRAIENDVVLADEEISRRHAVIQAQGDKIWLYDRDSFNGVFVNEQRLTAPRLLQHGDIIRLGHTRMAVEQTVEAAPLPAPIPASAGGAAAANRPAPAPSSQTRQAALVGGLIGLAGVIIVALLVLRPLWNNQGATPLAGDTQQATTRAARASAFLLAQIEDSSNSIASTGAVLSDKGRILTAYSAVYDPATQRPYNRRSQVLVGLSSDPTRSSGTLDRWYLARVVRADHQRDLAVLQIFAQQDGSPLPNSFSWPALATSPSSAIRPGASIFSLSYPGAAANTPTANPSQVLAFGQGQVTGILPDAILGAEQGWLQTSLGLGPGNLGAPIIDAAGRLVGVYTGGADVRAIEIAEPLLKGTG